ncbi:hypothetical protein Sjap_018044 [Stephania japonica]|uniref:Uncharacterized protein n=1 Tax=Stephania japonica TaxID=461633 RepID=A0AAP0I7B5_9MAGN
MSAIPLESVVVNEVTPIEDYWNEPEEIIEVSLHEPDISIAQNEADEAEKVIDVLLERPEEPQKRRKEDQPRVLVTPPTLPCLPVLDDLLNLKEGTFVELPKAIDAPFVVDISKGEGIT